VVHRVECELTDAGELPAGEDESFHVHLTWNPTHGLTLEQRAQRYKELRRKLDRFHERLGEHEDE
jgi:hypothetical protein